MKKFISLITTVLLISNFIFSENLFSSRFCETNLNIPINLSNNAFSLNDIFVKDLVIDLSKIAEQVPDEGFEYIVSSNPKLSSRINFLGLMLGWNIGIDGYAKLNISKDVFELLGSGYKVGDTVDLNLNGDLDIIAYAEYPIGIKIGNVKVNFTPGTFLPLMSLESVNSKATIRNDSNGDLIGEISNSYNLIISSSIYNVNKDFEGSLYPFVEIKENKLLGFDISGSVEFPIIKNMDLIISGRIPIIPGKLNQRIKYRDDSIAVDLNVGDFIINQNDNTKQLNSENNESGFGMEDLAEPYYINRPLKLSAYTIYSPIREVSFVAGGGFVINHPFDSVNVSFFPEYYGSVILNFLDFIKLSLSTEYTNQIFIHEISAALDLLFVEVHAGLSMNAANFVNSFNFKGIGGHVSISLGL